jgi:hypothetical protein
VDIYYVFVIVYALNYSHLAVFIKFDNDGPYNMYLYLEELSITISAF